MAVRYHFLASEKDFTLIRDWFSGTGEELTVVDRPDGIWFYFRGMAIEPMPEHDKKDQQTLPLAWVSKPQNRNGMLWTDAEVCFTATPLKAQFPALNKISLSFAKWLKQFNVVYSQKGGSVSDWNYYLEGGIKSAAENLYALPDAMTALENGRYFVHHQANDFVIEKVVGILKLRGYDFNIAYPV